MGAVVSEIAREQVDTTDRAVRLLRYLQEFVKLRSKVVRSVSQYQKEGFVQWLNDVPQERDCASPLWADMGEEDPWLEVHKQTLPALPEVPKILEAWVDRKQLKDSLLDEPSPRSTISVPVEIEQEEADSDEDTAVSYEWHRLEDHPEVSAAWDAYLPRWKAWAALHASKAKIQELYSELFRAYQLQQRLGEAFEFVVGFGLLSAKTNQTKQLVRRHVLVARAELRFDKQRGVISVTCPPPPEGAALRIEDDFLEPQEQPTKGEYDSARAQIAEIGDAVWNQSQMNVLLRTWANTLYADIEYSEALKPPSKAGDTPRMAFAPALILRRRTITGVLATYAKIIEQIEKSGRVPFGFRRLVDHLEDKHAVRGETELDAGGGLEFRDPTVLFPLPANEQQRNIVHELAQRRGVLVQGPPGTGKSQTIANLLCHFLALGKRVLVTSETPRALAVLKSKIPEPVQALCVSLLGADTASFAELERSINGIGQRYAQWNPGTSERLIREHEKRLTAQRERRAEVERELRILRESETHSVTVGGGQYRGTAAAIARQVNELRERHGWLALSDSAPELAPLSDDEALQLLETLNQINEGRRSELARSFPDLADVPTAQALAVLIGTERKAHDHAESFEAARSHEAYRPLLDATADRREGLEDMLGRFLEERRAVRTRPERWTEGALHDVLKERESAWKIRLDKTCEALEELQRDGRRAAEVSLRLPDDPAEETVLADASDMLEYLRSGGRWTILGIPTAGARGKTYLRKQVQVNGRAPESEEGLVALVLVLKTSLRLDRAWKNWTGYAESTDSGIETQIAELSEHVEALELVFDLLTKTRSLKELLDQARRIPGPDWTSEEPERLLGVVEAVGATLAAQDARAASDATMERLDVQGASAHPVNHRLVEALRLRDLQAWKEHLDELAALHRDREAWLAGLGLMNRLQESAPELAEALQRQPEAEAWQIRLRRLGDAWSWAIADRWLRQREDEAHYRRLIDELDELLRGESESTELLAAEKAWQEFLARLTPKEKESLEAWQLAVKQVGKGTGKHAEKHRAEARRYMEGCIHAIPAWIVPRYRVAEVLQPEPELFDVVIVDEASQTGIDGLFLYYLGKQTIIVGDHQQISPAGIGVPEAAITELQRRYVDDIPFQAALQPTASLYDHAKIKFQGRVVLREHFRCMPEIIQFSNDLCYAPNGTPLIPLRTYPPDRLDPVVTRFISTGYQEGTASIAVNRPEAKAVVEQILACVKDTRYSGKSFGVISLLGSNQARLIQELLMHHLGAEILEERALVCGDAYAFQGDERDVIFLSMVSAPNARVGALTTDAAFRRFNVATSRARDQMWLFYSVQPEDLSDHGVRRRLLDYCLNPQRTAESGKDRFDSQFEREVCSAIRGRGFRVVTQVPAGDQTSHRYRIDLVVEGMTHRLAVECDGDTWHGPEAFETDMARQRQLERAGWQFVRIRGGGFYRDRERSLDPLWNTLEELAIEPRGAEPAAPLPLPEPEEIPDLDALGPSSHLDREDEDRAADEIPPGSAYEEPDGAADDLGGVEGRGGESTWAGTGSVDIGSGDVTSRPRPRTSKAGGKLPQLRPYGLWSTTVKLMDPLTASPAELRDGLRSIVQAEGPLLGGRLYQLYVTSSGGLRVGAQIRRVLNRATFSAEGEGELIGDNPLSEPGQMAKTFRLPDQPEIDLRELGPRTIHEIPPAELAGVLAAVRQLGDDEHTWFRRVLEYYGLSRLRSATLRRLAMCRELIGDERSSSYSSPVASSERRTVADDLHTTTDLADQPPRQSLTGDPELETRQIPETESILRRQEESVVTNERVEYHEELENPRPEVRGQPAKEMARAGTRPPGLSTPSDAEDSGKSAVTVRDDVYSERDLQRDRDYIASLPATELLELSHWAKESGHLHGWQRGVLYGVGLARLRGSTPSNKQIRRAAEAHREGIVQGFRPRERGAAE